MRSINMEPDRESCKKIFSFYRGPLSGSMEKGREGIPYQPSSPGDCGSHGCGYGFGVFAPPILVYFGDWDVDWGHGF